MMGRHRLIRRHGGIVRTIGAGLAVLALALQTLLPLADARWHAARGTVSDDLAVLALAIGDPSAPQAPEQSPATTDRLCQLCIGLHATGAPPPTGGMPPITPIAYHAIEPVAAIDAPPPQRPGEVNQPRAPPVRA